MAQDPVGSAHALTSFWRAHVGPIPAPVCAAPILAVLRGREAHDG